MQQEDSLVNQSGKVYEFHLTRLGEPWKTLRVACSDWHEIQVLNVLTDELLMITGPHQKHEIIHYLNDLGSHDEFESKRQRTSMRKLQQILRDLTELGVPIVRHVKDGVWIAQSVEEIEEYADWIENKAKADIKSMMYMRKTMLVNAGLDKPGLFDSMAV